MLIWAGETRDNVFQKAGIARVVTRASLGSTEDTDPPRPRPRPCPRPSWCSCQIGHLPSRDVVSMRNSSKRINTYRYRTASKDITSQPLLLRCINILANTPPLLRLSDRYLRRPKPSHEPPPYAPLALPRLWPRSPTCVILILGRGWRPRRVCIGSARRPVTRMASTVPSVNHRHPLARLRSPWHRRTSRPGCI